MTRPQLATSLRSTLLLGFGVALAKVTMTVPFMDRYGWHRDELYFLQAAKHPALGYVDFPPITSWVGWAIHVIFGDSLLALRATGLVAAAVTIVLVAVIARELGGSHASQLGAAAGWALTPFILGSGALFHPTWFDALAWVAFVAVAVRLVARREPRLWLLLGAIAGIGFEAKYTILFLVAGLAAGLLVAPDRRVLLTRGPWLGLAAAVAFAAPNLLWEAQHGWPSVHFFSSQSAQTASDTPPPAYLAEQVLFLGAMFIVAVIGVVWLWRRARLRALACIPVATMLLVLLERGRGYYAIPADVLPIAAGAVALEGWVANRKRLLVGALVALQLLAAVVVGQLVLPIRDTDSMVASGIWKNSYYKDEIGWPELVTTTARAWRSLTPAERRGGVVLAGNYGEAGALALYGPAVGLPTPLSGHLSWQFWRPRKLPQRFALTVGLGSHDLAALCSRSRRLATLDNRWQLDNEERGRTVDACTLRRQLGVLWKPLIARDDL
jgi:4-amino-4-deoxy-L-arabinose transferase-like glycosyltransferase